MYVVDTNVISELRKSKSGRADAHVVLWAQGVIPSSLYITSITVLELELGVLLKERKDPKQGLQLRAWLDNHVLPAFADRILPIDAAVAKKCAQLHVPNPCPERDALIAATCLVHGMVLVTRNEQDFKHPNLNVLNPWKGNA